ncbi:hypothetical protein Hanom_Chr07g00641051 [Helianthus anomalus]
MVLPECLSGKDQDIPSPSANRHRKTQSPAPRLVSLTLTPSRRRRSPPLSLISLYLSWVSLSSPSLSLSLSNRGPMPSTRSLVMVVADRSISGYWRRKETKRGVLSVIQRRGGCRWSSAGCGFTEKGEEEHEGVCVVWRR